MRQWKLSGLVLLLILLLILAGSLIWVFRSVEISPDLEAMQGLWKVVHAERNGVQVEEEAFDEYIVFTPDRLVWYRFAEGLQYEYLNDKIRLDPSANPKRIDLFVEQYGKEEIRTNIYEFVNDELILLLDPSHESYPVEFITHKWDGRTLIKLRRIGPIN